MKKFWNWVRDETDPQERTLRLEGAIAEESWFDDEISPKIFRQELFDGDGPITVWINSPGGDCVAAAQIYNMLMDYPHDITVKVDGLAASAASVIAMAGTRVVMTPVSLMMIHNPLTVLISLGTNDGYNPPVFKENMRQIIELTLADNRLPILMLKADNVEKNFSINQDIADLAKEYDLPVWNFWAAIQQLENHGLQSDGIHLTFYSNYFSHPKTWETAWAYRNLTALQVLEKLQFEIESILDAQ